MFEMCPDTHEADIIDNTTLVATNLAKNKRSDRNRGEQNYCKKELEIFLKIVDAKVLIWRNKSDQSTVECNQHTVKTNALFRTSRDWEQSPTA